MTTASTESWQRHDATVYRDPMGCATHAACVAVKTTSTARSMMTAMNRTAIVALTVGVVGLAAVAFRTTRRPSSEPFCSRPIFPRPAVRWSPRAVEFQPGGSPGRHTHPGGGSRLRPSKERCFARAREGKPNATLRAGEAFLDPSGNGAQRDEQRNREPLRLVATYIVEKGKPLATPAPAK